ncbi:hypothetical protein GVN24_34345 [Rhizobium sp. CRIBSB]|nr:hypothetical protein [Rhizobium sp. CRIBSB]
MLAWLLSFLPPRMLKRMLAATDKADADAYALSDMRGIKSSGRAFGYAGNERLHREKGYASFEVADIWSNARWGITFEAVRDNDADWVEIVQSMRKHRDRLAAAGNALLQRRNFEKDGSLLIRDLKVQA